MARAAGDLDGVPRLLLLLVGEEGVAQDCEKASIVVVVAVAPEGEDCIFMGDPELDWKANLGSWVLVGVRGTAGVVS